MFGKLLKYDFRSMLKQFAFIWPAALVLALVNHFTMGGIVFGTISSADGPTHIYPISTTAAGISMLVYVAILIAMFVIALIFVIQRFYKGLLGDEGYLMHTLPVRTWQLIGSKLLCAVVTAFISVVVAILSVVLILPWDDQIFREIFQGLRYVITHWSMGATHAALALLELCLFMMTSFATGYLQLYLAMAIGHLANKNRIACSVVAFIALNTVINALLGRLLSPILDRVGDMIDGMGGMGNPAGFHTAVWLGIAVELVFCAVHFAGTEFILRKKLNLE